ncbi:TIM-barrel domain-containing protein [Sunxiuqinia sp. A32]|uniref:TIM-barrel domain-containing protein n=1 Tax=Sunxiuqinia sp. A32 TaxID=3461496 RepID=UPI004045D80E
MNQIRNYNRNILRLNQIVRGENLVIAFLMFFMGMSLNCFAQTSFLCSEGVAVFYPNQFDAGRVMPSLAITKSLYPQSSLPADWAVKPLFFEEDGQKVIQITCDPDADLYGTGEVTGGLRRNGTSVQMWNTDNYTYTRFGGECLYQSHPWILGVRKNGTSFGIISDNSWKQDFELNHPIRITTKGPWPRLIIIEKNTPQEVLEELANLTGKMELPPIWALGYQQCRYSYFPYTRVKEIADEFRQRRIPCDVIWMDIDYMNEFRVFTFDNDKFPNPKGLNSYLHDKGFKSVYMIDPGIKADPDYFVYQQGSKIDAWIKDKDGEEYHGKVWPGICAFPDFTRPDVQSWWSSLYDDFMSMGVDGVWNDMNEPAVFETDSMTMPSGNIHMGGGSLPPDIHGRYHNVYGMLMVKASREGILKAKPESRPFVLSRSNFLGGQRYGATWTGDNVSNWDYFKMSIPMSINLSLSGQPFNGPDIGGFSQDCNGELLANWIALGAYYPFSRNHSSKGTVDQEPWAFGKKVEDVSRTAINRRYRLLPYLYTLFYEASQTGLPVMRPVFMSDVQDTTLRFEQECFLLGGDLLIIPRWSYEPRLPQGDWDILKLEKNDDGYQPYVALRSGAIVPIGKVIQNTTEYSTDSLTLLVNPDIKGNAFGRMYDDAGDGFGYKVGDFAFYQFKAFKTEENKLKIQMMQKDGKNVSAQRYLRVGYVIDNKIVYSSWTDKSEIIVDVLPDNQHGIELSKLKMTQVKFNDNKDLNNLFKKVKIEIKDGENF